MPRSALRLLRRRRSRRSHFELGHLIAALAAATAIFGTTAGAIGASSAAYVYARHIADLAPPEALARHEVPRSTRIYDRHGELLHEIFGPNEGRRTTVPLGQIARTLVWATIATEDARFYENPGVDWRGLARAAWVNLRGEAGGGSSITQQLIKNVLIPPEERNRYLLSRKIKETILAFEVTRRFSKDQILEWYLNRVDYGNLAHGAEAASQVYFGKPARDLTLAEAALLAGLPQAPSEYSPAVNPALAKRRQEIVLDLMAQHGFATAEQIAEAKAAPLDYAPQTFPLRAPHFVQYVREVLERRYGRDLVEAGGLRVYTTVDLALQERAEQIIWAHLDRLRDLDASNAATAAIDPATGEILMLIGSADYFDPAIDGQVNVALSPRQPGSAFKPFTYATAFLKGWTPTTVIEDVRTEFGNSGGPPYVPRNVDGRFRGPVTVREALATSLNVPAVKALAYAGVDDVLATAHRLGITDLREPERYGLALTLGGGEVKLIDLVYAYSAFATGGELAGTFAEDRGPGFRPLDPIAIRRVEDPYGRVMDTIDEPLRRRVLAPDVAYLVTHILKDETARSIFFGPDSALKLPDRPAAVKTGTTDDERDNWTVGYTPDLALGVWVGNADGRPMRRAFGSLTAAPLWRDLMQAALDGRPVREFERPAHLIERPACVDPDLTGGPCRKQFVEVFPIGAPEPTPTPPPGSTPTPTVTPPPPTPTVTRTPTPTPAPPPVFFISPAEDAVVGGEIELIGTADLPDQVSLALDLAPAGNPRDWQRLVDPRPTRVRDGVLVRWDTRPLNGDYQIRLTAIDGNGNRVQAIRRLRIDNEPPRIAIRRPAPGADARAGEPILIVADAFDTNGVRSVEFLIDGHSIGLVRGEPFAIEYTPAAGRQTIVAIARDRAGHSARSTPVEVTAR